MHHFSPLLFLQNNLTVKCTTAGAEILPTTLELSIQIVESLVILRCECLVSNFPNSANHVISMLPNLLGQGVQHTVEPIITNAVHNVLITKL